MPYPANTRSPAALPAGLKAIGLYSTPSFGSFFASPGPERVSAVGLPSFDDMTMVNGWKYEPSFIAGFSPAFWNASAT